MTTGAPATSLPAKPADPAKSAAIMLVVAAALIAIGTISKNWVSAGRGSGDIHLGPLGGEACMSSVCVDFPLRGIPGDIEAIMVIAMISGFAAAAAAGTFGAMALAGKRHVVIPPRLAHAAFGLAAFSMTFFVIRMISEKAELSWAGFPAIAGVVLAGIGLKKLTPFLTARPALPPGAPQPGYSPQQSQPMQPQQQYGSQPYQQPSAQQSQPMQPHAQYSSQPYVQPMQPQQQYGSQPYQQPPMQPPGPPPQQAAVPTCPRCGTQLHFVAQYQRWFCPREQQYV